MIQWLMRWFRKPEPVRAFPVSMLNETARIFYDPEALKFLDMPVFMTAEEVQRADELKSWMHLGRS